MKLGCCSQDQQGGGPGTSLCELKQRGEGPAGGIHRAFSHVAVSQQSSLSLCLCCSRAGLERREPDPQERGERLQSLFCTQLKKPKKQTNNFLRSSQAEKESCSLFT